jgi:hypothetical protein
MYATADIGKADDVQDVVPGTWKKSGTAAKKTRKEAALKMTEDGEPIIPEPSEMSGRDREDFFRAFVNHHYRE